MTLTTLILSIAVVAAALTGVVKLAKRDNHLLISFLQNFCGALFVFSGWVKAVDPLGTGYKMEQYFAEFETTFADTALNFLAPVFPWLAQYVVAFSVIMIVFEIVLGLMLLLGSYRKFTAWAFLLLVGFFTFLTGFTYLTGYVPDGVNFFSFSDWGEYVETNMKVTDCGCFGDFLKLEPRTSFLKDVFLLIPGLLFVLMPAKMHQWFTKPVRNAVLGVSTVGLVMYCLSNFMWDIPGQDFRPFHKGANIRVEKAAEQEAQENIEIIAYRMTNKSTGQVVELPYEQYLAEFKDYPKEEWKLEQLKSDPEIEPTKISDFEIADVEGNDMTEDILNDPNYSFMIVAYKLKADQRSQTVTLRDTTFRIDTLRGLDTFQLIRVVDRVEEKQVPKTVYEFDDAYVATWKDQLNPVLDKAMAAGHKVYAITGFASPEKIEDFRHATQSAYPFYVGDDILLKTIVRSNPGIVLLRNGEVINKWHIRKLPDFDALQKAELAIR